MGPNVRNDVFLSMESRNDDIIFSLGPIQGSSLPRDISRPRDISLLDRDNQQMTVDTVMTDIDHGYQVDDEFRELPDNRC
jgi:hypothetical protein